MLKNTNKGKFVVFEGLDGSGQTSQTGPLKDFLEEKGYDVLVTKEPTLKSEAGKKLRKALDKEIEITSKELQQLFTQDRKEHLENTIIPTLKQGTTVICDRYFFSSFAYGTAEGLDLEWLININDSFLMPDITFLLKVSPEICVQRIADRGRKITLFEKKEKLEKVWQVYKTLPERFENIYIIDGEKSIEQVFENIKKIIIDKFNL